MVGYPDLDTSYKIAESMIKSGTNVIELGIPFSDPVADGKLIQNAAKKALENDTTLKDVLKIAKKLNKNYPQIKIILMGYFNPIHKFGVKKFVNECKKINIGGLIIVDLPAEELNNYPLLIDPKLPVINLITSLTSKERLNNISKISHDFLYYISVHGVTGDKEPDLKKLSKDITNLKKSTNHKIAVGFGIKNKKQVKEISKFADGVVIGSKYIEIISGNLNNETTMLAEIKKFNQNIIG